MLKRSGVLGIIPGILFVTAAVGFGQATRPQAAGPELLRPAGEINRAPLADAPEGGEVTIRGALQCDGMCEMDGKDDQLIVIVAVGGSPEIDAKVKKVLDENFPDKGLDADAAQKLNAAFDKELKYYIAADSPAPMPSDMPKPGPKHYCHEAAPYIVTGMLSEKDGRKYIKVTKFTSAGKNIDYPEKLLMPDKPFVMPDKTPLVLKIDDKLTINCIKVPPGKLYMDECEFMGWRYVEQVPHMVTLTKSVYISEIPITQEMWQSVMGNNPSKHVDPKLPVEISNENTGDVDKFLKLLSQKTGKSIRLPTGAEWEYIARSGTSNPGFPEKYRDQGDFKDVGKKVPAEVKTHKPNAWGFYDLFSPWWELLADGASYPPRRPETDPMAPLPTRGDGKGKHMLLGVCGENWTVTEREFEQNSGYASKKFRIAFVAE